MRIIRFDVRPTGNEEVWGMLSLLDKSFGEAPFAKWFGHFTQPIPAPGSVFDYISLAIDRIACEGRRPRRAISLLPAGSS